MAHLQLDSDIEDAAFPMTQVAWIRPQDCLKEHIGQGRNPLSVAGPEVELESLSCFGTRDVLDPKKTLKSPPSHKIHYRSNAPNESVFTLPIIAKPSESYLSQEELFSDVENLSNLLNISPPRRSLSKPVTSSIPGKTIRKSQELESLGAKCKKRRGYCVSQSKQPFTSTSLKRSKIVFK